MIKRLNRLLLALVYVCIPATLQQWSAALRSMSGSPVKGSAIVESRGSDSVTVTISIDGAPAQSTLHWHVSEGPCSSIDGPVGNESDYPPLRTVGGSHATVRVTLRMQPPISGDYAVRVHGPTPTPIKENPRMAIEKTPVVACGELRPA